MSERLQATGFRDEHRASERRSYFIVNTPDGERTYEYTTQVQLSCIRHIYPALNDYTGFEFEDHNGFLVITEKGS
jgi:hypothetical protein